MKPDFKICPSCGEKNNPTFRICHKCSREIPIEQKTTDNGIIVLSLKEFYSATFGGRPNQMGLSDYEGHPFQCICGKPHNFSAEKVPVMRELKGMRLVLVCPEGVGLVCVKATGVFKFKGFESIFGTNEITNEFDSWEILEDALKRRFNLKIEDNDEAINRNFSDRELTEENELANKVNYGKHFYQFKYAEHYEPFLKGLLKKDKVMCELFLFRAWTTQFGFRIFSSDSDVSEKIIYQIVNLANTLGKGIFSVYNGVDCEETLFNEIGVLVEQRWGGYDDAFIAYRDEVKIPANEICLKLCEYCEILDDPEKLQFLRRDFLKHLDDIKNEAISIGLLKI